MNSERQILNLKNPVIREKGGSNGKGLKKRFETKSSTASSVSTVENRCAETHLLASLQSKDVNELYGG